MKKLFAFILALVMVFSLTACGDSGSKESNAPSNDEVYTVSLQFSFPETNAGPLEEVLDQMEEASNGRLKFELYYSNSMIANADVVDALQFGSLNIAGMMPPPSRSAPTTLVLNTPAD